MFEYLFDDRLFVTCTVPYLFFIGGIAVIFFELVVNIKAEYGRYNTNNSGVPVRLAWFIQELPSFAVPCYLFYHHWPLVTSTKFVVLNLYLIHYLQRCVVRISVEIDTYERQEEEKWHCLRQSLNRSSVKTFRHIFE